MAPKSKNPKIALKNPDVRAYVAGQVTLPQMTDSGAGIAAGRICEFTSGSIKLGTEQNALVLGITRNAIGAAAKGDVEFGFVPAMAGSPVNAGDRIASRASGYIGKAQTAQVSLLDATAGGNFANQPGGAAVVVKSDSTSDTTQTVTIYGTKTGTTGSVTSEVISLNGTTAVTSVLATWQNILAVRISAAHAGTVTVELAGGNDIITIATGTLTAGIAAAKSTQAYGLVPRRDGSGASTAPIAVVGTGLDGAVLTVVAAMDGTTEGDLGSTPFATVTEFYIGAVASTVSVNVLTNEASDASAYCGIALQTTAVAGVPIDVWLKPYWM